MITPNFVQHMIGVPAPKLAEAYIPIQAYRNLFNINEALHRGTIFKELYQPYKTSHPWKF
ncbi:MAG TPA: spore coat associated protein CotJA [Haloplasmataceae bacterium]|jgi:hypothetical protein